MGIPLHEDMGSVARSFAGNELNCGRSSDSSKLRCLIWLTISFSPETAYFFISSTTEISRIQARSQRLWHDRI